MGPHISHFLYHTIKVNSTLKQTRTTDQKKKKKSNQYLKFESTKQMFIQTWQPLGWCLETPGPSHPAETRNSIRTINVKARERERERERDDTLWSKVVEVDLLAIWQKIHDDDADACPAISNNVFSVICAPQCLKCYGAWGSRCFANQVFLIVM